MLYEQNFKLFDAGDRTFTPEIWEKALEARDAAINEERGNVYSNVCYYTSVNIGKTLTSFYKWRPGPCHASLFRRIDNDSYYTPLILNKMCNKSADKERLYQQGYRYIDWLINDSFVAPYFLEDDATDVIEDGITVMTGVPSNVLMWALVALRRTREAPDNLDSWNLLYDNGINGTLAYILQLYLDANHGAFSFKKKDMSPHSIVNSGYIGFEFLKNFLNHTPILLNKSYYGGEIRNSPNPALDLFGTSPYGFGPMGEVYEKIKTLSNKFSVDHKGGYVNPFPKVVKGGGKYIPQENILDFANELLRELKDD